MLFRNIVLLLFCLPFLLVSQVRTIPAKYAIEAAQQFKQAYTDAFQLNFFYYQNFNAHKDAVLTFVKAGIAYADSAVLFASQNDSIALWKIKMAKIYAEKGMANFHYVKGNNERNEHAYIKQGMFYIQNALDDAYYASLLFSDTSKIVKQDTTKKLRDVTRLETDESSFMTVKTLFDDKIEKIDSEISALESDLEKTDNELKKEVLEEAINSLKEQKAWVYEKLSHTENKLVLIQNDLNEEIYRALDEEILMYDKKGFYSDNNPIPQNVELPEGVVYRVQIGFFMNELPYDKMDGLFPLSTEKVDNVYFRYLVGLFYNYQLAKEAKEEIRARGYKDAFIVSYLNGKRIPIADALKLEEKK